MSIKYHDQIIAGELTLDTAPIVNSTNAITSGGVVTALNAAKNITFSIKLAANRWNNGIQTVTNSNFFADGYTYTIIPGKDVLDSYVSAGIYADDVTTDGSMMFYCNNTPNETFKVNVLRMASEIIIPSFAWGADGSTADADWFAELQEAVQDGKANSNWVGLTKSVTLTSAVQGTTTHLIQCIGVNQDGNNTITFQTKNCLTTSSTFGNAATWSNSTVRTICQNYYNAFPGKNYIKTVAKGTNTIYNTDSVAYTDETVWLPSIYEVGLGSFSYKPVGAEYTQGCSTPYSYYVDKASRIKYQDDSSSTTERWWTRSRSPGRADLVCDVLSSGSASHDVYNGAQWVAPAFVIG